MIELLAIKNLKIIFRLRNVHKKAEWLKIITDDYKQEKVFIVNVKTGDDNNETYAAINDMMAPWIQLIPDYQACKKEVERIRNEIAQINQFSKFPKHL